MPKGRCTQCGAEFDRLEEESICPRCGTRPSARQAAAAERPREFGKYVILEEVNRGAMGIVYRAREKHLPREVALKVLIAGEHASEEQVRRFVREARAVARLRHPNIVPIHDIGEVEGKHYFTMDFVRGRSLAALIEEGTIAPARALDIVQLNPAALKIVVNAPTFSGQDIISPAL